MENIQTTVLVVHTLIALGIIGLVLLQRGKGADAGASFGSGSSYAVGAMHAVYDTHSAKDIVLAGLEAAAAWDDSTGAPFEVQTMRVRRR